MRIKKSFIIAMLIQIQQQQFLTFKYYTYLQIKFDQNDVAFFNIQLYGYEAQQQKSLDNLQVQPIQFGTKINLKNQKKDTKDRHQQEINKFSQQEKQDLEDAVKNSLISYQTKEMNNKQIIESIKYAEYFQQQQEYEFQDLGIEIEKEDNDLQKYQYEQKKQPQLMSENLGYTDNKNVTNFGFKRNTQEKKGYQQQQQQQQQNNVDPIKLHLMTKYKAEDINEAFMKMHQLLEETGGVKRFLENVMFN
ncbi:unnamed protein product [Paramecium primaurelia]|uniref:Uncharacterized protein n=1 Tax=Paramecium primaurelia TaxID=5886 RepID=A0A8S1PAA0_PARPR|nr:unnamed protein product [Paramecium primaurelia]